MRVCASTCILDPKTHLAIVRLISEHRELRQLGALDATHRRRFPVHQHVHHRVAICTPPRKKKHKRTEQATSHAHMQPRKNTHAFSMDVLDSVQRIITTLNFDGAVLRIQRVVVQVHHAGQRRREAHAVRDAAVAGQPHQFVALGDVVQEAEHHRKGCRSL